MTPEAMQRIALLMRVGKASLDERQALIEGAQQPGVDTADDLTGPAADAYAAIRSRAAID